MALQAGKVGVYPQDLDKEGHIKQQTPVDPYVLPVASPTTLGGVKPIAKTEAMTQDVGVDGEGKLYAAGGSGISKIYTKTFEMGSSSTHGSGKMVWNDNVGVSGYTPIAVVVRDKSSGHMAFGGILKNRDAYEGYSAIAYASSGSNFQAIVYYIADGDIQTLS